MQTPLSNLERVYSVAGASKKTALFFYRRSVVWKDHERSPSFVSHPVYLPAPLGVVKFVASSVVRGGDFSDLLTGEGRSSGSRIRGEDS